MPLDRAGFQQQIIRLRILLITMTIAGTLGYMVLEDWEFVDSLYMTVITLSTVGFGEVNELSTMGRLFTTLLIVCGVGVVAYSFGSIGQYLISGELRETLRRRSMQQKIDQANRHVIICGFGRVGRRVTLDREHEGRHVWSSTPIPSASATSRTGGWPSLATPQATRSCCVVESSGLGDWWPQPAMTPPIPSSR